MKLLERDTLFKIYKPHFLNSQHKKGTWICNLANFSDKSIKFKILGQLFIKK